VSGGGVPNFIQQWYDHTADALRAAQSASAYIHPSIATIVETPDRTELLDPPPEIMLQAVVELGDKTPEGHIIQLVSPPWFEIVEFMRRDPKAMYQFDWRKWEEIIAGAYKAAGFTVVVLTPASGDKGRDVIASRDDIGSIRFIDQVKRYAPGRLVTYSDVMALIGVLSTTERKASKGIITTTSDFAPGVYTDPDIQRLMPSRLELRPGPKLIEWLGSIAGKPANKGSPPGGA
jgi:restriction system protein